MVWRACTSGLATFSTIYLRQHLLGPLRPPLTWHGSIWVCEKRTLLSPGWTKRSPSIVVPSCIKTLNLRSTRFAQTRDSKISCVAWGYLIKNLEERELHDLPDAVVSSFMRAARRVL